MYYVHMCVVISKGCGMGLIKNIILFFGPYHGRKQMTKSVVCPNCKKTLLWPTMQEADNCVYCGVYFMIGYPLKGVSDEF